MTDPTPTAENTPVSSNTASARKTVRVLMQEYLRRDSFMPILRTHLENEIDTLVGLEKYADKCDWGAWFQKVAQDLGAQGMKSASHRNEILPLAMILHDKTFEGGIWGDFPPLPWLAMVAIRWLFVRTHQDWWRFAGCDSTSMPQELPFA